MEEADGVVVTMVITRGVEVEVEEAAQVPKARIVEDQLNQDLEAGTMEGQVDQLYKVCRMGSHPDHDLKAGKVEDKVDNKA